MENTPRLYDTLVEVLRQHRKWLDVRHLKTLAWMMVGLIQARVINLTGWAPLCWPHGSLREELPCPIPTKGRGLPKKWRQRTSGMAAGITDHVWKMSELLMFRVPPWRQQVIV